MPGVASRGAGRPRGVRSGLTKERIVAAACGVFGEFGYRATTFQAVADRADVTRPAVNHYFPRKQLLYTAVLAQTGVLLDGAIELARTQKTLIEQLSSVISSFAEIGERQPTAAAFAVTAALDARRDPELRSLVGDIQGTTREFLAVALADAMDRGELRTDSGLRELTDLLLAALWGVVFYVSQLGGKEATERVAAGLEALLAQRLWQLAPAG
ncbi:TetR/AcrR family transcriptional regulator [Mycolicibacter minnesotensis]